MDLQTVLAYRPEQFQFDFTQVLAVRSQEPWLPGYRGWVFAPQPWLSDNSYEIIDLWSGQTISRGAITFLSNPLWQRLQLGIAYYLPVVNTVAPNKGHSILLNFRLALIEEQMRLIGVAANWCQEFLGSRVIEKQVLSSHPVVAQLIARLIRDVYALNTFDRACLAIGSGRHWLIDEIDSIGEQLIKLVGGRAMLSGQMVYLRTLFLTLNRLYLED